MIKLLIGGSPCTHWSIAQSKNRETTAEGIGWELFLNYVIAKEKFKPDFFLYENNWSASKEIKDQIQEELGCKLMRINSKLVSAQNRDRFYVVNWDVEYHAYEIDKYAIKVAMSNYPDIIQHGDAFQVRNADWSLGMIPNTISPKEFLFTRGSL